MVLDKNEKEDAEDISSSSTAASSKSSQKKFSKETLNYFSARSSSESLTAFTDRNEGILTRGNSMYNSQAEKIFSVAVVLLEEESRILNQSDPTIAGISHMVSGCRISYVIMIRSEEDANQSNVTDSTDTKFHSNGTAEIHRTDRKGYWNFLLKNSSEIQAIYVALDDLQEKYNISQDFILPALDAGKHVLVKDRVSTSMNEYIQQLQYASKRERFIQFVTMYQLVNRTHFLQTIVSSRLRTPIQTIHIILTVSYQDLPNIIHLALPSDGGKPAGDKGCIRSLGRFCILLSCILLMDSSRSNDSKEPSLPVAVQVVRFQKDPQKCYEVYAECLLKFSHGEQVTFQVGYTTAFTRQVVDIQAQDRYASVTDFVVPHPDGLATYRVYDKAYEPLSKKSEVVQGEAIDVPSELPEHVMLWRRFRKQCLSVQQAGWGENPITEEARLLTQVALQTKRVILGLYESMEDNGSLISLDSIATTMDTPLRKTSDDILDLRENVGGRPLR